MMRVLRSWSLLLVPGGFVAGHELGYQGASLLGATPVADGGHGYLATLVLVGVPFAFAAVARSLLAGLRDELPPVRWTTLAAGQVALFSAVELAEHARVGLSPLATLAEPAVVLGLAAQLVVAALLVLVVRSSRQVAVAVAGAARRRRLAPWRPPAQHWGPPPPAPAPALVAVSSLSRRGPPARSAR
ncbi:MAG TPA: hypothetical protein VFZ79_03930 [Acidimicrobiales bacterium]